MTKKSFYTILVLLFLLKNTATASNHFHETNIRGIGIIGQNNTDNEEKHDIEIVKTEDSAEIIILLLNCFIGLTLIIRFSKNRGGHR